MKERVGEHVGEVQGEYLGECLILPIPLFIGVSAWLGEYGEGCCEFCFIESGLPNSQIKKTK